MEMPGLVVDLDGDATLVQAALDLLGKHRWPEAPKPVDEDAKTPAMQNITHRGVKVSDKGQ